MPLVQDGVARPESEALVKAHLAACPACRALWQGTDDPAMPEQSAPMTVRSCKNCAADTAPICCCWPLWALRRAWPWGYTGSANWVILFLPCVWAVLTCRDTGMGKPLLLFTLGLAVLDAIIKQTAFFGIILA